MSSLRARRVIVTRPLGKADHLIELLEERGADVVHWPTIAIADPASWEGVDAAAERLRDGMYAWAIFTSVNAVERFLGRAGDIDLGSTRVAAVGSATTEALNERKVRADLVPEEFTAAAVAQAIGRGEGTILLPRVEGAPREIVDALETRGWKVDEVVSYRNVLAQPEQTLPEDFDAVTFASGSAARNFATLIKGKSDLFARKGSAKVVVCIGSKTAEVARQSGLPVDVIAPVHTDEGMVEALEKHVSANADGTIGG